MNPGFGIKKIILILCAAGLAAGVFSIFISWLKNKPDEVTSLEYSASALKEHPETKSKTLIFPQTETIPEQPANMFFQEFLLPPDLKAELSEAVKNGKVSNEWGQAKISADELQQAGLTPAQMPQPELDKKIKNITAGYSIAQENFADNLTQNLQ